MGYFWAQKPKNSKFSEICFLGISEILFYDKQSKWSKSEQFCWCTKNPSLDVSWYKITMFHISCFIDIVFFFLLVLVLEPMSHCYIVLACTYLRVTIRKSWWLREEGNRLIYPLNCFTLTAVNHFIVSQVVSKNI